MLTGEYGNMSDDQIERLGWASRPWPDDIEHEPGCTEPWVSRLVADFVLARGARRVLETGCYRGSTSVWILEALKKLGGGWITICDIDPLRCNRSLERLLRIPDQEKVTVHSEPGDILAYLQRSGVAPYDLAWVDDCHEKPHVRKELQLLYPKMNPGGLILLHDVYGSCDLKTVVQEFGGYSIDLPRLGPAGGLGIIQVPS